MDEVIWYGEQAMTPDGYPLWTNNFEDDEGEFEREVPEDPSIEMGEENEGDDDD